MNEDTGAAGRAGCPRRRSLLLALTGLGLAGASGACGQSDRPAPVSDPADGAPADARSGRQILARTTDVPVAGGVVASSVLLTQPTTGSFRAFSILCPHRGARVSAPVGGVITCWEHNSTFSVTDGTRIAGPANRGLTEVPIAVEAPYIFLA